MRRVLIGVLLVCAAAEVAFVDVKVGEFIGFPQLRNCTAYHALLNYRRTQLAIMPRMSLQRVMWTDVKLDECTAGELEECRLSSVLCGVSAGQKVVNVNIGTCVDDLYIYVLDSVNARSTIENLVLLVSYENTSLACDSVAETDYTMCGAKSELECDVCDGPCRTAICHERKTKQSQGRMCLPANTTQDELNDRCEAFANNDYGEWKRECSKKIFTGDIGGLYGTISGVLILSFFALFFSVLWYNFRMKRSGRAPIHCLRCCPDMLFPRDPPQLEVQASSYRPPEFYSD